MLEYIQMTNPRDPGQIISGAFPGITPLETQDLISNSRVNSYPAGTVLCHENELEQTFYMILDGEAEVTKSVSSREDRLLKTLTTGDFFGEMALIHNAPRAATVAAKTPLTVLELGKEGFDQILERSSSIAMALVREISKRLRQNDEMAVEDLRMRAGELAGAYQKLAEQDLARREFLTNVAHELRTPLMTVSGYLQMIQRGVVTGDQLKDALGRVAHNVEQIVLLVNDILFLQELELVLPEFQSVNMADIVQAVITKYRQKAEESRVRFRVKGERDIPQISGDPNSLERALAALIDNAIKFSPSGGEVEIRFNVDQANLILIVEDHGIGIADESRLHIFDRFYHIETNGEDLFSGLGLGLAITRQVIEQHRGVIEVESTPDRGSVFKIILPLWNEK